MHTCTYAFATAGFAVLLLTSATVSAEGVLAVCVDSMSVQANQGRIKTTVVPKFPDIRVQRVALQGVYDLANDRNRDTVIDLALA
jgi:hypothetical protein